MTLLLILLLLLPFQSVEYGQPSELKGVRRVFVATGDDLKNRERIAKELRKAGVEVLSSPESAEVVLSFTSETAERVTGVTTLPPLAPGLPSRSRVRHDSTERGKGVAFVPVSADRRRVLFSWSGDEGFTSKSASKFASAFVKAYKKANGLK